MVGNLVLIVHIATLQQQPIKSSIHYDSVNLNSKMEVIIWQKIQILSLVASPVSHELLKCHHPHELKEIYSK